MSKSSCAALGGQQHLFEKKFCSQCPLKTAVFYLKYVAALDKVINSATLHAINPSIVPLPISIVLRSMDAKTCTAETKRIMYDFMIVLSNDSDLPGLHKI
jgi:hypothetical protein